MREEGAEAEAAAIGVVAVAVAVEIVGRETEAQVDAIARQVVQEVVRGAKRNRLKEIG